MPTKDENQIAARILRRALQNHDRAEARRALEFRKAWRQAAADLRKLPKPGRRIGRRIVLPPLTPEELARIGSTDGLDG